MHAIIEEKHFNIIIVDEDVHFRNSLATQLRFQGYNVDFANGGFHLLHVLEKQKEYDLVILHENMADMSAEEMISLVRTSKTKIELPILFISKGSVQEEIFNTVAQGANDYIVKTSSFAPILDRVRKYTHTKNS